MERCYSQPLYFCGRLFTMFVLATSASFEYPKYSDTITNDPTLKHSSIHVKATIYYYNSKMAGRIIIQTKHAWIQPTEPVLSSIPVFTYIHLDHLVDPSKLSLQAQQVAYVLPSHSYHSIYVDSHRYGMLFRSSGVPVQHQFLSHTCSTSLQNDSFPILAENM